MKNCRRQTQRKRPFNDDDLLWAMATLGFEDYIELLKVYLARYREVILFYFFFS
jgi:nuclear transcription Y subunit beta